MPRFLAAPSKRYFVVAGGLHYAHELLTALARRIRRQLSFRGRHRLADRGKGSESLLVILAGYKPHLWPYTLARIPHAVPDEVDVCLVSAGRHVPELDRLAATHGWSYLSTSANQVSVAQNLAVRAHPRAEWVYKIDEDVFIDRHFVDHLRRGYERVLAEGEYQPGFCSPVVNVNGFSYLTFVRLLGLEGEYLERFGEHRRAPAGIRAHDDGEVARWIWERSLPFDDVAAWVAGQEFAYSVVPHRFSIGAIVMRREFWEEIGGLPAHPVPGRLGVDEEHLCRQCLMRGKVMIVLHDVLAGHFAFWPQDVAMRQLLQSRHEDFAPRAEAPIGTS